jgi:hypothetical protein
MKQAMTNTHFLMKSKQTATKISRFFMKGEQKRWQSYLKHSHMTSEDASRARKLYRALWNF